MAPPRHRLSGFTLIELLLVLTIIVVLFALVAPAVTGIATANNLSNAEQLIVGQFNYARQMALTGALPVEVRFYSFAGQAGDPQAFRAIQVFQLQPDGSSKALNKTQRLPVGIIMLDNTSQRSTLLQVQTTPTSALSTDPQIAGVGSNYLIERFSFQPDGSTKLSVTQSWHVTLARSTGGTATPANFSTIQVDPLNGTTRTFRPGI